MAEASIPVNLFNPGQVFACQGFLEAADVLSGDAEGGFDWSKGGDSRFRLRDGGDGNPFGRVLAFLAGAEIRCYAPPGHARAQSKRKRAAVPDDAADDVLVGDASDHSETFPGPTADVMALPIRLVGGCSGGTRRIEASHWADGSSRNDFKLYAGNRSATAIARDMLNGTREKPTKRQKEGDARTLGLGALWSRHGSRLEEDPFGFTTPVGGTFNFDPRGAWTGIDAGYSPNDQKHRVSASPVVEILAAIGLEHARPDEYETRRVRYAAWSSLLPPVLARAALAGGSFAVPKRRFCFELALSGKNKVVTFAQEEAGP